MDILHLQDGKALKKDTISKDSGKPSMIRSALQTSYIKHCLKEQNTTCHDKSGVSITDLNIWDKALTSNQLINWTTCR